MEQKKGGARATPPQSTTELSVLADHVMGMRMGVRISSVGEKSSAVPTTVGGMKLGVFTPTEAAVAAAVYALLVGMFVYRELSWRMLYPLLLSSAKASAAVVFLIATALVSAWLITVSEIPQQDAEGHDQRPGGSRRDAQALGHGGARLNAARLFA
jgi:hypothetical protein